MIKTVQGSSIQEFSLHGLDEFIGTCQFCYGMLKEYRQKDTDLANFKKVMAGIPHNADALAEMVGTMEKGVSEMQSKCTEWVNSLHEHVKNMPFGSIEFTYDDGKSVIISRSQGEKAVDVTGYTSDDEHAWSLVLHDGEVE